MCDDFREKVIINRYWSTDT